MLSDAKDRFEEEEGGVVITMFVPSWLKTGVAAVCLEVDDKREAPERSTIDYL